MSKPKVIAFYLPQFHPTPNNDKWWGKGFTEWTNVGKAEKLFKGHYQPKVPADLGYYDLRVPVVREQQAQLAKEAGIYGFCYYHYWFGNGQEELQLPFDEVVRLGKPDFPFMLCWANESWHKKFWNKDTKGTSKEILAEQTYPGVEDHINHFYRLLPAFKDNRYIKFDGKLVFMIYKPLDFPNIKEFTRLWNELAIKEGLKGFYFIGQAQLEGEINLLKDYENYGLEGLNTALIWFARNKELARFFYKWKSRFYRNFLKKNYVHKYRNLMKYFISDIDHLPNIFPTLIPNWDHSPRSGKMGFIVDEATPDLFYSHIKTTLSIFEGQKEPVLFLKSWNEWGEGNYMEPDLIHGKRYIEALARALKEFENK